MLKFTDLPYIVHKQIVDNLYRTTWAINRKLELLGVCRDWREIALPQIYGTLHIGECNRSGHKSIEQWRLSSPSGSLWDLNVAPFNAHDVARHAKRLRIVIYSVEGFQELTALLKYIISLNPGGWVGISKLDLWLSPGGISAYTNNGLTKLAQSLHDFIFDAFPGISSLKLEAPFVPASSTYLFDHLLARHAVKLQSLTMSFPMSLDGPFDLHKLTVLDLKLASNCCQLLSFVEPQILHKLSLTGASGIYIWSYFSLPSNSDKQLEFAMLTDLYIESHDYFDNPDVSGDYESGEGSDAEYSFSSEYQRVYNDWEHHNSGRKVLFPCLQALRVDGGHFANLLFKNCTFPNSIDTLQLRDSVDIIQYNCWILSHVSANYVSVQVDSGLNDYTFIKESKKIVGSGFGNKIASLKLYLNFNIDPVIVDLPILQTLYIDMIKYSTFTALISKLSSLRRFTVRLLNNDYDGLESGYLNLDPLYTKPLSTTIVALTIQNINNASKEKVCIYIRYLVIGLPNLRFATFEKKYVDFIKAYIAKSQDIYHHLENILLTACAA